MSALSDVLLMCQSEIDDLNRKGKIMSTNTGRGDDQRETAYQDCIQKNQLCKELWAYRASGLTPEEVAELAANRQLWLEKTYHGIADVLVRDMFVKTPFEERCASVVTAAAKGFLEKSGFNESKDYNIEASIGVVAAAPIQTIEITIIIEEPSAE